jgi:transposase InsO family protein
MDRIDRQIELTGNLRDEWPRAGDMIHVDIKPLGRIGCVGHRIHWDRRRASPGVGWEYVHGAVDDHSRIAYVDVLRDQLGPTGAGFVTRAVAWFRARAIVVRRVLSDKGSGYVSGAFRATCAALAVRHRRTQAYTPRANGKAERFIQTLLREWAYAIAYATSSERRRALRRFLAYYNRRRPHAGLEYEPPWSRLPSAA